MAEAGFEGGRSQWQTPTNSSIYQVSRTAQEDSEATPQRSKATVGAQGAAGEKLAGVRPSTI